MRESFFVSDLASPALFCLLARARRRRRHGNHTTPLVSRWHRKPPIASVEITRLPEPLPRIWFKTATLRAIALQSAGFRSHCP